MDCGVVLVVGVRVVVARGDDDGELGDYPRGDQAQSDM